jgi:glycosyltransferase involved in cell wall biosynthesis
MSLSFRPYKLLVIAPAYNEEGVISRVVCSVHEVLPEADMLVIDDGSGDATAPNAAAAGAVVVRHPFNLGIGATVQTGLRYALSGGYDYVVRVDGDGQHSAAAIPVLLAALRDQRADAAFGSRFLSESNGMAISQSRRVGIAFFAALVSLLTGQRATDTTSGFCCLNRRAVALLARYMPQDYPEVESRIVLHKAGLQAIEVPITMQERHWGTSSITRWRSIYYAAKVTLAVLITVIKDIPRVPEEPHHVDTIRPTAHSYSLQHHLVAGDRPVDPPA